MLSRLSRNLGYAIREAGQALDRVGAKAMDNNLHLERLSRHRQIMPLNEKFPILNRNSTFVAPNASVIGDVEIKPHASVWYGCVIRGDVNSVKIGSYSNIQDRTIIHCSTSTPTGFPPKTIIGEYVTVGHGCMLYSCTLEDNCVIGMGSIILEGAVVEKNAMVAAGSVVPPGRRVPAGQLWAGNPVKFLRNLTEAELAHIQKSAETYAELAQQHEAEFLPFGTAWWDKELLEKNQQ